MADTKIDWADKVWNPVTGCTKVSAGCAHCYAERIAKRLWASQYEPMADGSPRKFTDVVCHEDRLDIPRHWKKPARIFVNSMSDLFHEDVPDEFIDRVGQAISHCEILHTFIILTKRPQRMMEYFLDRGNFTDNVWLGVSVENQKAADERIPLLLQTPAAVRFVSVEPMLGAVNLTNINPGNGDRGDALNHRIHRIWEEQWEPWGKLDWVICGSESGQGARPFDIEWARSLKDQCVNANVPFFLKQARIDGKLVKMPELDGKVWGEYPCRS